MHVCRDAVEECVGDRGYDGGVSRNKSGKDTGNPKSAFGSQSDSASNGLGLGDLGWVLVAEIPCCLDMTELGLFVLDN